MLCIYLRTCFSMHVTPSGIANKLRLFAGIIAAFSFSVYTYNKNPSNYIYIKYDREH